MRDPTLRHALVTGASGGLGRVVCATLLSAGFRVSAVGRRRAALDGLCAELGGSTSHIKGVEGDASRGPETERVFDLAEASFGPITAAVHCVGTWAGGPLQALDDETLGRLVGTNFTSTVLVLRAALSRMVPRGDGRVVLVGSLASEGASAGAAVYGATKAAVAHLVRSASEELRASRITVNAVLPGTIDTPENRRAMPDADPSRWTQPEHVARAIAALLSDDASTVTGTLVRLPDRT